MHSSLLAQDPAPPSLGLDETLIRQFLFWLSIRLDTCTRHLHDHHFDMTTLAYIAAQDQPLTPLSPSLPTSMPPLRERIPQLPITPPLTDLDPESDLVLATAVHVLSTEATALSCLSRLYQTDPVARRGFATSVECISRSALQGGKLVVTGVGKSGKIGEKLVSTMNSLGISSVFLHPVEALHGDLGLLRHVSLDTVSASAIVPARLM